MERLEPKMSVDASGNIIWVPAHVDYDPSIFFRGKKVTDEEFNGLFLKQAYQSNHTADSLSTFLDKHLGVAIHRRFVSSFNLAPSYVKTFTPALWGTLQPDGYYYINIPASEHGFPPNEIDEDGELSKVSIAAEMSLMSDTGQFYTVPQVEIDAENNVRVYTDDNTVAGFVIIRRSDKAFAVAAAIVDATQIQGLAPVAISARYTDLVDIDSETGPNTRIAANAADITKIINGEHTVGKALKSESAEYADYTKGLLLDSTIQGIPVSSIFEEGSSYVKTATRALLGLTSVVNDSLEPVSSKGVYDYITNLTTNNALDIENAVENKLATAKAIKDFMEEYYMKSVLGTFTNTAAYPDNIEFTFAPTYYYLVKQGNTVDLTLVYSRHSVSEQDDNTQLVRGQLSEGFYNTNTTITCISDNPNYVGVYMTVTNTGIIEIHRHPNFVFPEHTVSGSSSSNYYPVPAVFHFQYTLGE